MFTPDTHTLTDAELLTLLFQDTGTKNALDLANTLLQEHGLHNLFTRHYKALKKHPDFNMAKYTQLQAGAELHRRYLQAPLKRQGIQHPDEAADFLIAQLRAHEHEVFACAFLDNQHRIIHFEKLFHGTINHSTVYPREVVKRALYHNAAAVIAAHNHPSGTPKPSQADQEITSHLKKALALVDVRLLDHFIIAEGKAIGVGA